MVAYRATVLVVVVKHWVTATLQFKYRDRCIACLRVLVYVICILYIKYRLMVRSIRKSNHRSIFVYETAAEISDYLADVPAAHERSRLV